MKKIAILFGGPSSEYEVSLSSAKNIIESIDRNLFNVLEVHITKDCMYDIDGVLYLEREGLEEIQKRKIEVVFPVLHGAYGEDGTLQRLLEQMQIPFVGSSSSVSSLAIDKNKTNILFQNHGLIIPKTSHIKRDSVEHDCLYPVIVKPVDEGSSVDLFKCNNEEEYKNVHEVIFKNHETMLIQECIEGREFTCGVIEDEGNPMPLLATEIILTQGELFDYDAKYTVGGCIEVTPAEVHDDVMKRIQNVALTCHTLLGCKSLSRTDMILRDDSLYVLETNTMPGMTKTSFIPAQAQATGYSMKELVTILINSAHQ